MPKPALLYRETLRRGGRRHEMLQLQLCECEEGNRADYLGQAR
jgi:hypothetical protein